MSASLLFIPDISGYTKFIQSTEIEHAEHVIAEILEVLIAANTEQLELAEIEGDALFFFKEGSIPSQESLLALVETMFTAFYSHLKLMEKNRICTCNACATAPKLQLKIIAHAGDIQFLKVQGSKKPFGNAVITVHRLLKNSVDGNNYLILSKELGNHIGLQPSYKSELYQFSESSDVYDDIRIDYNYANIDVERLQLKPFAEPINVTFNQKPSIEFNLELPIEANELLEIITNYRYRHLWVKGVDSFEYNENEVTRLGTEHLCVINGKQLNFVTVTKKASDNELIYGELSSSPAPVDEFYNFFTIQQISTNKSRLKVELYLVSKSPIKKLISYLMKGVFKKGMLQSLQNLKELIQEKKK